MRIFLLAFALVLAACGASGPAGSGQSSRSSAASSVSKRAPSASSAPATTTSPMRSSASAAASSAPAPAADWRSFTKPSDAELHAKLTPLQYQVTQQEGTEPPFSNAYWDNHADGIYVDVVSGEPLFSSKEKYDSGTGWPSFWKPLAPENVVTKTDTLLGYERTEVRSKHADSHLGHVFDDGPQPTGLRYCMDSASLRFIPAADLAREGYGEYAGLFQ